MPCFNLQYTPILILYILSTLSSLCLSSTVAYDKNYRYHFCSNTTTFTANSSFQSHRDQLLSTLVSNATRDNGFYNATAGGQISNETVYGLFLCRGDLSKESCSDCVTAAASDVVEYCPIGKQVLLWYDYCMIRYSNYSFFSTDEDSPWAFMWKVENVTQDEDAAFSFNFVLGGNMYGLAEKVVSATKKFATHESSIRASNGKRIYSLGQCTQDLSTGDCNGCLSRALAGLPRFVTGKTGGRCLLPSCNIRFDLEPFYTLQQPALPPWQPLDPAAPPTIGGKTILN